MTAARAKRVDRLEEASVLRTAREVAREYALTEAETAELLRDTRWALARWRAGLPIGLAWVLDEATKRHGLDADERAALEADRQRHLTEQAGAR